MGLLSFLLGLDKLGHSLTVTYKGNETHPTILGAIFTITIQVLVIIKLVNKSTSLISMSDPSIQSYERPLYQDE